MDKYSQTTKDSSESLTVSPAEFAQALGIGRDSVYAAIRAKKIVVIRPGRAIRIPRSEIDRVLREGLEL